MAEVKALVCDLCGLPARRWKIQAPPDVPWTVDLCDPHASDIRALRERSGLPAPARTRNRKPPAPSPEYV